MNQNVKAIARNQLVTYAFLLKLDIELNSLSVASFNKQKINSPEIPFSINLWTRELQQKKKTENKNVIISYVWINFSIRDIFLHCLLASKRYIMDYLGPLQLIKTPNYNYVHWWTVVHWLPYQHRSLTILCVAMTKYTWHDQILTVAKWILFHWSHCLKYTMFIVDEYMWSVD